MDACFLCRPNRQLVYSESRHFFAMLGLGPIVEGYSLLATKAHIDSMFDLPDHLVDELGSFTTDVIRLLSDVFRSAVTVTEHGRVGLCEMGPTYDAHCYHAHRLLFPATFDIVEAMGVSEIGILEFDSFSSARRRVGHLTEYLYAESPGGSVFVGTDSHSTPRQFFRGVLADATGKPHLQSWRRYPRREVVESARRRLGAGRD